MTTLGSIGSGQGRYMPNGKVCYYVLGKDQDRGGNRSRWSSVEIPVSDSCSDDSSDTFQVVGWGMRELTLSNTIACLLVLCLHL